MIEVYAWTEGAGEAEVAAIKRAMDQHLARLRFAPTQRRPVPCRPQNLAPEGGV
jgi:hypothetical protein